MTERATNEMIIRINLSILLFYTIFNDLLGLFGCFAESHNKRTKIRHLFGLSATIRKDFAFSVFQCIFAAQKSE